MIFNNMGISHGSAYTDFNAIPDAGSYYIKGTTNGPNVNSANQYYGMTLGLGSEYGPVKNQTGKYGSQIYWGRNVTNPYINIRYLENGSWGSWRKVAAGYADSAATATTATNQSGGTVSATTGTFSGAVNTGALTVDGNIDFTPIYGGQGDTNKSGMIIFNKPAGESIDTSANIDSIYYDDNQNAYHFTQDAGKYATGNAKLVFGSATVSGTVTASAFSGNASTATTLATARAINGVDFDGSAAITITANTPQTLTRGNYLTGSNFNGGTATTWAVDATEAATASKIVARNSSGDIYCRLLRPSYGNQATISGAMAFRVNNSNDNYVRFCSDKGAIRTFLDVPTRTGGNASGTWGIAISGNAATATTATNQSGGTVNATTGTFSGLVTMTGQQDNADGQDRSTYWDYDDKVALMLKPAANDGAVAILFPSQGNLGSDFAYIAYDEDYGEAGVTAGERGALILGCENDGTGSSDHVRVKARLVVEADTSSSDPTYAFQVKSSNTTSDLFNVKRSTGDVYTSGALTATTVTASAFSGNASTATTLATARAINGVDFDGSAAITITANTPQTLTRGNYLTGSNFNG